MRIATGCAAAALLFALGCSKNETVQRVKAMADRACACTDATCADRVEKEYLDLVKEGQKRGSDDDRDDVARSYSRMRTCIAKARTAGGAATDKATQP
jgi:hypothetical protein